MSVRRLEILVGPIASGKSTYARSRALEGALVVCHDDLTRMLHAGHNVEGKGYETGLRDLYREIEQNTMWICFMAGRDVVVDRTHLTYASRRRWIDIARVWKLSLRIEAVAFPIEPPEVHARRRFEADPRGRSYEDWLAVARHHDEQARLEPLDIAEGFHDIRYMKRVDQCLS